VVNGVATRYLSDGAEEIEERNGSNALLRQFVNGAGIDEHLAIVDATLCPGGGRCFLRTNWQGSTTHLVAQSGALVETYHYGPYGERLDWTPQDGDSGNPYRYTGRRYDAETGLYYYRARYYSPKLGRFLQTDPIGTKDDVNLYTYTLNDSVNHADPTGTDTYALSGAIDIFLFPGFGIDAGLYFNPGLSKGEKFDVGLFAGGRLGLGFDLSGSINASRIRGSAENINGFSGNAQLGVGPVGYQRTVLPPSDLKDKNSQPGRADSVGVSISPLPVSANITAGYSRKFGLQDVISAFKSIFGPSAESAADNASGVNVTYDKDRGFATAVFQPRTGSRIAPPSIKTCVDRSKCGS
jgi:RHS repeat-associated protein